MSAAIVVDHLTGEAFEYASHREAMAGAEARNRGGQVMRPDRPRGHQGGPRFMVYPSRGGQALELVNLRRLEYGMAALASLRRREADGRPLRVRTSSEGVGQ